MRRATLRSARVQIATSASLAIPDNGKWPTDQRAHAGGKQYGLSAAVVQRNDLPLNRCNKRDTILLKYFGRSSRCCDRVIGRMPSTGDAPSISAR